MCLRVLGFHVEYFFRPVPQTLVVIKWTLCSRLHREEGLMIHRAIWMDLFLSVLCRDKNLGVWPLTYKWIFCWKTTAWIKKEKRGKKHPLFLAVVTQDVMLFFSPKEKNSHPKFCHRLPSCSWSTLLANTPKKTRISSSKIFPLLLWRSKTISPLRVYNKVAPIFFLAEQKMATIFSGRGDFPALIGHLTHTQRNERRGQKIWKKLLHFQYPLVANLNFLSFWNPTAKWVLWLTECLTGHPAERLLGSSLLLYFVKSSFSIPAVGGKIPLLPFHLIS